MKTTICAILMLISSVGYSQIADKICNQVNTIELEVDHTSKFPSIENFKGDFQFRISSEKGNKSYALTDKFFELVAEMRKDSEDVTINLGDTNVLVIASKNSLNANGFGPFDQPFIQK